MTSRGLSRTVAPHSSLSRNEVSAVRVRASASEGLRRRVSLLARAWCATGGQRTGNSIFDSGSAQRDHAPMFVIVDKEHRRIVDEFYTRDEADARLAELLRDDPQAEGVLVVESYGEAPKPKD